MKKGDKITDTNGREYTLIDTIGRGGQAKVWKVCEIGTNKIFAYKVYKHDKKNVRGNIEELIKIGAIKDSNGNILKSVIMPIAIVNGDNDSFGYIMELVDLKDYTTLKKAWSSPGKYPGCFAICNIVKNFAQFFDRLHIGHGMCYKDVNEGNIFFNPVTGDIKIIDNDNIGIAVKLTIKGTPNYMAPEIVLGKKPDAHSDRFSFAVFIYRLLVGGYPFDGPYTENYCTTKDILPDSDEARKVIFGTDPVFVWNPTDKRNSIEHSKNPQQQGQAECWKKLPENVKKLFINTFVTNLPQDRRAERTSNFEWRDTFEQLEKNLRNCSKCGKKVFADSEFCFECGAKISQTPKNSPTSQKKSVTAPPKISHSVTFLVLSKGESDKNITLVEGKKIRGSELSKHLASEQLLEIVYNEKAKKIGAKNLSRSSWTVVKPDKSSVICEPSKIVTLEDGVKIRIIQKTAQLNVIGVN